MKGLLYSCIGYDLHDPKWAMIRADEKSELGEGALRAVITEIEGCTIVWQGEPVYWGEKWGSCFWRIDFSELDEKGAYVLCVLGGENVLFESAPFEIGYDLLLRKSVEKTAIIQFEQRNLRARNKSGWLDCGSDFKEACAHTAALIGLAEFYYNAYDCLNEEQTERLLRQIMVGCDYLALLQDRAEQVGHKNGMIIHEITKNGSVILGDMAQFVVAMIKASRILSEVDFAKSGEYLERAEAAMQVLLTDPPYRTDGFQHWNHGAPEGYEPPREIITRDLLMMLWGAVELMKAGKTQYEDTMLELARQVMARQVPKAEAEDGLYGHFYAYPDKVFTDKAFVHHDICMDSGMVFPNFIVPLYDMYKYLLTTHPELPDWEKCMQDFAYGYLLPACERNPYCLMPMGVFGKEGLLDFCGPWHGWNTAIGYTAALALILEDLTGDYAFRRIAVGNLQWIAGLHCGLTNEAINDGSRWAGDLPEGQYVPMSQIQDVGSPTVQIWSRIPGSVANGFCTNHQFEFKVRPCKENDVPRYYGDEDWAAHSGGWLYALGLLKVKKTFSPEYWNEVEGLGWK